LQENFCGEWSKNIFAKNWLESLLVAATNDFFGGALARFLTLRVRKSRGSLIKLSPVRAANREAQFN
jgi:hypothetical protein